MHKQIMGYFPQWGIYARNFHVKNLVTSGAAEKLTTIFYAFGKPVVSHKGGVARTTCALGDPYADTENYYDAASSVSGEDDSWEIGALRGSFNQLRELKQLYPDLQVVISIGGWSWSDKFSAMAQTAESRQVFVASCIDLYIKGNFAPGMSHPGVFDGIDIDWEYPGSCGLTCDWSPDDGPNFVALLAEFRRQLDEVGAANGRYYSLHIASPAAARLFEKMPLSTMHEHLDTISLMAYDMHGTWENTTNFNAPLYGSPEDPALPPFDNLTIDHAVQEYLKAGIPSEKLVMGIPFYGRGWTNVPDTHDGLYQTGPNIAPAEGTFEKGFDDFHVLNNLPGFERHHDPATGATWIFDGATFWNFEDATSIAIKTDYINSNNLGGAMFWDATGDDESGTLITLLYEGLHSKAKSLA